MSIYRKVNGGVWYYSVYVPGGPRLRGTTGKLERSEALLVEHAMRLASSRRTPKDHLIKIIEALYDGEESQPDIALEAMLGECERISITAGKKPSAGVQRVRKGALRRLAEWRDRRRPDITGARCIDRRAAQAFSAHLIKEGLTDKSRWNIIGNLSTMWNILKREHDKLENPWPMARPLHVEDRRRDPFSPEEVARLFAAADAIGHGWGLSCRIAAATGLRYGDVARLKYGDIRGGAIVVDPGKTRRFGISVVLPLPPDLLSMIGTGEDGEYLSREQYEIHQCHHPEKSFRVVMERAGVEPRGRTFHCFRHYFRTQLARAGVADDVAMRLGGWTQRETAARYDHDDHRAQLGAAIAAAWALGKTASAATAAPRQSAAGIQRG